MKPRYVQTVVFKVNKDKFNTELIEYNIYFDTEAEFSQFIDKCWKENPTAIGWKRVGSKRTLV